MIYIHLFLILLVPSVYSFITTCPSRCQCYEDLEDRQHSLHLICKWEQINSTNLQSLGRPELVRTLTIRCPYIVTGYSTPSPGIFYGLRNLDRLEIDRCLLRDLHPALLTGLHKLYSLIIRNSKLDDVPKDFFGHVPNLMTLDLTGNKLRIEPYSLRSLRNLIHLDLSNNSITFLANTLISLTKLKVLNMDHNKLTNIDFRRLPEELTDLSLRHNSINTIHYVPNSARFLRRMDLSGNDMEYISSAGSVNVLPISLRSVDLSHNRINYIQDGAISKVNKLSVLDLKNNSLTELKESAVAGTPANTRLRLFLSDNPFNCHCNIRWLLQLTEQSSITVSDMEHISCSHLIEPNRTLVLTIAENTNQLLCKYTEFCPKPCSCCAEGTCSCRSTCPTGCVCYRSANLDGVRTMKNAIMCDRMRLDRMAALPSSLTDLHLNNVEWKDWNLDIFNRTNLKSLSITNSALTEDEANTFANIPTLMDLDISSNQITVIPEKLRKLTRLRMADNPLKDLHHSDVSVLNEFTLTSLGGNRTKFKCDCDTPTSLQQWLRDSQNREKVEDLDKVTCHLPSFGKVPIAKTLPGKDSLCLEETPETKDWLNFIKNAQNKPSSFSTTISPDVVDEQMKIIMGDEKEENKPHIYVEMAKDDKNMKNSEFPNSKLSYEDDMSTTTATTTTKIITTVKTSSIPTTQITYDSTTLRNWKKFQREESDENKFINALIVVLVIAIVVLIFAIAATLYYRLEAAEEEMEREGPEERPLTE